MDKLKLKIVVVFFLIPLCNAFGLEFRVEQIPNGKINTCANCHINPNGGGKLNPFGQIVFQDFVISGNVTWNAELAALDSDKDGFTNGEELQDPLGLWREGDPSPGNAALVTLPGIASSKPTSVIEDEINARNFFDNLNIFPNPFSKFTNIEFDTKSISDINIGIYNESGVRVRNFLEFNQSDCNKKFVWDGKEDNGNQLPSGQYLIKIIQDNIGITEKIYIIK